MEVEYLQCNPRKSSLTNPRSKNCILRTGESNQRKFERQDGERKPYPVLHLYMMTEGYIPQSTGKIKAESSDGHSLKGFGVGELLHTRQSWEAMRIAKENYQAT